jgi:hypothetical protein
MAAVLSISYISLATFWAVVVDSITKSDTSKVELTGYLRGQIG